MKIAIHPAEAFQPSLRLWQALETLFPVQFIPAQDSDLAGIGALICLRSASRASIHSLTHGCRCLIYTGASDATGEYPRTVHLQLGDSTRIHPLVRGFGSAHLAQPLRPPDWLPDASLPLATLAHTPFWWHVPGDTVDLDVVATPPPVVLPEPVSELFYGQSFGRIIPLVTFLQRLTAGRSWQPPSLRAAFMFDDPNLRAVSYGYIGFQSIASDAAKHNYHVSFATIPLDAWSHSTVARALFREWPDRLSLLIHGNNHTRAELAQTRSADEARGLIRQALLRIGRLERATGLPVARVMAAPHGACNEFTAEAMLQLGIEAACISRGSLRKWNPGKSWPAAMGLRPSEFLADGFPVIPRYPISVKTPWSYLAAAMLGQPVVIVAHHQDVAAGYQRMAEIAAVLNSRGNFAWRDLTSISRSNYLTLREGNTLRVRLHSRRIDVPIPEGVTELKIECPWEPASPLKTLVKLKSVPGETLERQGSGPLESMPTGGAVHASISVPTGSDPQLPSARPRVLPPWPLARRILAEGRDRLLPVLRPRRR